MRPTARYIAGLVAALSLSACTVVDKQLYIASDTSLGVNGAANTAQTAGKLVIGYDRKFVAYVPKKDATSDSEVMSAYNCTHLEVQGLRISKFVERLATGEAAKSEAARNMGRPDQDTESWCARTARGTDANRLAQSKGEGP